MKIAYLCALPLAFSFCFATVAHADDDGKVEIKEKNKDGKHEFKMKVTRKGDHYVGFYNNREYTLRGDAVSHINTDGDYVIYGDVSPDNTYIETTELRPVVVQQRVEERRVEPAVRDREVIIEKRDDPMIKVGPLKIGN
jgi:hypothetical protein